MRMVIGDLEADGLLDEATRVWCGVFMDIRTNEVFKFLPDQIEEMLDFLRECEMLCIHNGIGYDLPLLEKLYGFIYPGKIVDTLLMSRLQDPQRSRPSGCKAGPHSVEAWGMRFGRPKPEHEDWTQFSEEMLHRCTEDVNIQRMMYSALIEEGRNKGWEEAHKLTHKLFEILQKQEEYGWLVDQPYMEHQLYVLTRWMDKIDRAVKPYLPRRCVNNGPVNKPFKKDGSYSVQALRYVDGIGDEQGWPECIAGPFTRVAFDLPDLGSNQQVKDTLLHLGWKPAQYNYKDGVPTSPKLTHDDPFEGIESGVGRLVAKRVKCRHRRSVIEGWQKNIRPDGRVAQRITNIAATGRLIHGVIVNVPGADAFFGKQMRKVFTHKEGYKIVGIDSAACQNRMLAARVGDPDFTKTLLEGKKEDQSSIHYVNMRAIEKHAGLKVSYKVSKNLNYAFMFGAQDPKLASTAGVAERYGALIRKGLLSVSPGLADLVESLEEEWRSTASHKMQWGKPKYYGGCIRGLDGRPVYIEKEHTILVYTLQSDEAIMMQYALLFLYKWCTQRGWVHGREYGFVANVHDEIQAEVREDLAEEFAALGRQAIVRAGEYLNINCPHQGESDIGDNWYETH